MVHTNVCLSIQSFRTLMTLSALPICCSALSNGCEKKPTKEQTITACSLSVCTSVRLWVCVCVWVYLSILYIERAFVYRCASTSLAGPFADVRFCFLRSAKSSRRNWVLLRLLLPAASPTYELKLNVNWCETHKPELVNYPALSTFYLALNFYAKYALSLWSVLRLV